MRIDRLEVENFRCFEKAEFEFSPHFNLLVGINGSGKTSLLMAVAAAASCLFQHSVKSPIGRLFRPEFSSPFISEAETRLVMIKAKGSIRFERNYPLVIQIQWEVSEEHLSSRLDYIGGDVTQISHSEPSTIVLNKLFHSSSRDLEINRSVIAFYASERRWQLSANNPENALTTKDSRLDAYKSWDNASLDMKSLETWVITKSLERLELIASNQPESDVADELFLVNQAISSALEGAKGLRYDIKNRQLVLDWQTGDVTPFDLLSDGQNVMCALVADIARRMCLLNPQLGDQVLKETPGIVMIDELDMHLHPAWQRRIVHALKDTFPKVQFFAASHSPQIIGELPPEEILLLRDGKSLGHPARALGMDSGAVLEEVMGATARNGEVAEELKAIRLALDDNLLDEARRLLDELTRRVGEIPEVVEGEAALDSLRWLADEDQA